MSTFPRQLLGVNLYGFVSPPENGQSGHDLHSEVVTREAQPRGLSNQTSV